MVVGGGKSASTELQRVVLGLRLSLPFSVTVLWFIILAEARAPFLPMCWWPPILAADPTSCQSRRNRPLILIPVRSDRDKSNLSLVAGLRHFLGWPKHGRRLALRDGPCCEGTSSCGGRTVNS
ncbi:hypothetical protein U1Q18_031748 [Sarracenia purpurea var. burkii]